MLKKKLAEEWMLRKNNKKMKEGREKMKKKVLVEWI